MSRGRDTFGGDVCGRFEGNEENGGDEVKGRRQERGERRRI